MDITISSLATNPYSTVIGLIFTILSVVIAIIFYLRSKKEKIPYFEISSNTILEKLHKSLDGLEVHYKGEAQERITVTKVVFWNDGKETIDRNHLVEKDPLRLICPLSTKILDVRIVDCSAESNSVQIGSPVSDKDVTYYPLSFEYLDYREYFVIQVIHNGNTHEQFNIEGKIKGVKTIENVKTTEIQSSVFGGLLFGNSKFLPLNPSIIKYFGSFTYFIIALFTIWSLLNGHREWYLWTCAAFSLIASIIMFFGFKIAPVRVQ